MVDVLQERDICKSGQFELDSVINWKPVNYRINVLCVMYWQQLCN